MAGVSYESRVKQLSTSMNIGLNMLNRIIKKNNYDIDLNVELDLSTKNFGYYFWQDNVIYVNPIECVKSKWYDKDGHPENITEATVMLHEFAHLITYKNKWLNLYCDYVLENGHYQVTDYAKDSEDENEELAELMTVYFTNPYFIKISNPKLYIWLRDVLKLVSPTSCNFATFKKMYDKWPKNKRIEFLDKWSLSIENNQLTKE